MKPDLYPDSQIHPDHFAEWLDSTVDPDLIRLNLKSLEGSNPLEYLLYALPRLIPQLEILARGGRDIYLAFDRDTKPKTIANVRTAIIKTGKLLAKHGCAVKVISWSQPEKGVDDLIAARGEKGVIKSDGFRRAPKKESANKHPNLHWLSTLHRANMVMAFSG